MDHVTNVQHTLWTPDLYAIEHYPHSHSAYYLFSIAATSMLTDGRVGSFYYLVVVDPVPGCFNKMIGSHTQGDAIFSRVQKYLPSKHFLTTTINT